MPAEAKPDHRPFYSSGGAEGKHVPNPVSLTVQVALLPVLRNPTKCQERSSRPTQQNAMFVPVKWSNLISLESPNKLRLKTLDSLLEPSFCRLVRSRSLRLSKCHFLGSICGKLGRFSLHFLSGTAKSYPASGKAADKLERVIQVPRWLKRLQCIST